MKRTFGIELLLITIVGLVYFALHAPTAPSTDLSLPALNLQSVPGLLTDTDVRVTGIEHERLAGVILPIQVGLQRYGHIPFWNSFLSSGVPLINNAFNYLFNPFHSLPVLIWGGVVGSKIAILIALLLAGYSTWAFGLALGLSPIARVTIGLLYMLNGSMSAKFGAGHFQLACSLAWPPLVFAALLWTLHSSKRRAPIAVGVSFALLFYAGNIYYTLHTVICCLVIVTLHLFERNQDRWHFQPDRLRRVLIAGVFAFGLSAVQFFPVWQIRDYVTHEQQDINADGTLANNYDVFQAFSNLAQPWQDWQPNHPPILIEAVDYAYMGNLVFILLTLAVTLQITKRFFRTAQATGEKDYTRVVIAALILAPLMMLWAGGQTQPIPWLYANIPLLAQFRFLGRALAIAGLWWIVLAGIALDMLWNRLRDLTAPHLSTQSKSRKGILAFCSVVTIAWLYLLIYSASSTPDRIAMVMRNVTWWQQLDTLRYTSLADALHGLVIALTLAYGVTHLVKNILTRQLRLQKSPIKALLVFISRTTLLSGTALGVLNVMTANTPALQFSTANITFDPIYADIHRMDSTLPFPSVSLPFSPYTFGAYEREVRVWSLNEGWAPAAPKPTLTMNTLINLPRWYITGRKSDGTLPDERVQRDIDAGGYHLRACYVPDSALRQEDCLIRNAGFNLYERPQALPYAFTVSDPILTNNPTTLNTSQVQPANVLIYQQDYIVIHTSGSWTDFDKHYLVLQEANFPGWQITRDGEPLQPVTVPTAFIGQQTLGLIAVLVESGDHTYTFRFEPPGLSTGILVFCGTLALILIYLKVTYKQKSPA